MPKAKEAHFKTNVLLKSIIGKDLINNDNIAILELVKNAYDAGSKNAEIHFERLKPDSATDAQNPDAQILISDWGAGMSRADVINKWLNIAYSDKKLEGKQHNRAMAGAKGIGRFSCDRLGKTLNMYTRMKGAEKYVHLYIDWSKFELEGQRDLEIQHIPVLLEELTEDAYKQQSGQAPFKHGTLLSITHLRSAWINYQTKAEDWTAEPIGRLRQYLERLLNPNQILLKNSPFNILVNALEFPDTLKTREGVFTINGPVENKIFEKLEFHTTSVETKFTRKGKATYAETFLRDKGRLIYRIKRRVTEPNIVGVVEDIFVVIYFLNPYAKKYFKRQTGFRSVDFGSVFLFKNGFRIPPYGDPQDDWLGLERRKNQGQRRFLGTRDIVGRIELNDTRNLFKEISSREGLVDGGPFQTLKEDIFYPTLKQLENYVVNGLKWDSIPADVLKQLKFEDAQFTEELFQLPQDVKDGYALDAIRNIFDPEDENIEELHVNADLVQSLASAEKDKFEEVFKDFEQLGANRVDKTFQSALNQIRRLVEKKNEEIQTLKDRAIRVDSEDLFAKSEADAIPNEVVALQHHINQASNRINRHMNDLQTAIMQGLPKEALLAALDRARFENRKIATLSRFVTKAKFNLMTSYVQQDVVQFVSEYLANVYPEYEHKILNRELLQVSMTGLEGLNHVMQFRPIDLIIVIDNLLDNAQKAGAKHVHVTFGASKAGRLTISFADNGRGLDSTIRDKTSIFDYGFTTTKDGSGIGLYHVKSVIALLGGTIDVVSEKGSGATFTIELPRS